MIKNSLKHYIKNYPDYAEKAPFILVTCNKNNFNDLYFFGAYNDSKTVSKISKRINGIVLQQNVM